MSLVNYRVPYSEASDEFIEKKSRFIGHIFKVTEAGQAIEIIKQLQKKYWDASCNAYGYIVEEGRVKRYSDDGEPNGTAGRPILEVLEKEGLYDVLCIATRYFGGVKLGAGGLTRAYGHAAKIAVDAAGVAVMQPFRRALIPCPYNRWIWCAACCRNLRRRRPAWNTPPGWSWRCVCRKSAMGRFAPGS